MFGLVLRPGASSGEPGLRAALTKLKRAHLHEIEFFGTGGVTGQEQRGFDIQVHGCIGKRQGVCQRACEVTETALLRQWSYAGWWRGRPAET